MGSLSSAAIDRVNDAAVTVDMIHHQIHLGNLFEASGYAASIADAGNLDILVRPGAARPHVRGQVNAGGSTRVRIYEGSTVSADGASVTIVNRNRNSLNTPVTTMFTGPTVTGIGTLLVDELLAGGSAGGNRTIGSSLSSFEEYILKPDINYILRLTNVSGVAVAASFTLAFYEP